MEPWLTESSRSSCQRLLCGRVCTSSLCRSLLARALGKISATYTKHGNNSNRLLQSLVDSEAMRFANRTICDIVCLAQEFDRCDFCRAHVRGVVNLHRQRTMSKSALAMPQRVEEATVNMMMPEKVARSTEMAMIEAVAKYAWNDGHARSARY